MQSLIEFFSLKSAMKFKKIQEEINAPKLNQIKSLVKLERIFTGTAVSAIYFRAYF